MDQLYDDDSNGLSETDEWRKSSVGTYRPGSISNLVGKRVYTYSSGTTGTPSGYNDTTYAYDPVGNTVAVYNANTSGQGNELYSFSQDAFGNELSDHAGVRISERTNLFGGTQWATARAAGVTEHQTGKWIDPFTGDYYFHARWYDAGVGRLVGRDKYLTNPRHRIDPEAKENTYTIVESCPTRFADVDGLNIYEAMWCMRHPFACAIANMCKESAYNDTRGEFGDEGGMNTPGDAFRHCTLACCLARNLSRELAQGILDAHELDDVDRNTCASIMDMHNNMVGMDLANGLPSVSCAHRCRCARNLQTSPNPNCIDPPAPMPPHSPFPSGPLF